MKKIITYVANAALVTVIGWALYTKAPAYYNAYKIEGTKVENFEVPLLSIEAAQASAATTTPERNISSEDYTEYNSHTGPIFNMVNHNRKVVLVFWITTCGFCRVELERLNNLVTSGQVAADSILAVAVGEDQALVTRVTQERGYRFRVALDPRNVLATKFNVRGTPTVVFINEDRTVEWMTVGASSTLPTRVTEFIN